MAYGDIGAAEIERLEYDPVYGVFDDIVKVADGVVAIFNSSVTGGIDGTVRTYPIDDAGNIGALIDSWTFVNNYYSSAYRNVCKVANNIWILSWRVSATLEKIATIGIADNGTITPAFIDSITNGLAAGYAMLCLKRHGTSNAYVELIWKGTASYNGSIRTFTCDADGTNIAAVDSYEYAATGYRSLMAYITEDVFAILSYDGSDAIVKTVLVDSTGNITAAVQDSQIIDNGAMTHGDIMPLGGDDLVICAYRMAAGGTVLFATLTIDDAGTISAVLDTAHENDAGSSLFLLKSLGYAGGNYYFMVGFNGTAIDDGIIMTWSCDDDGDLIADDIDKLTIFENNFVSFGGAVEVQPSIWCFVWVGPGNDGYISTVSVETVIDPLIEGVHVVIGDFEMNTLCYGQRVDRGRETELGYAPAGVAELTMDNSGGDFSPENAAGAYFGTLDLGISVDIYEVYDGVKYQLFTGQIEKIVPQDVPGGGGAQAFILCTDGVDDLVDTIVETPLRTTVQAGQLVEDILDDAEAFVGARDIDTGITTFDVAFFSGKPALAQIRIVEDQERGRFYIDVDGDAQFEDRHHRILNHHTSEYDFGTKLRAIAYEWSKRDLYNRIQITGTQYTVAITLDEYITSYEAGVAASAIVVPANGSVTIWAISQDVIESYVTPLVAGTHWNTNTEVDKSGTDTSGSVTVAETQYGKAIKLVFTSTYNADSFLVVPDTLPTGPEGQDLGIPDNQTALIIGKTYTEDVIQHVETYAASIAAYRKKGMSLAVPFLGDPDELRTLASFIGTRHSTPQPMAIRVTIHGRTDWPTDDILKQALTRKISDRITLASTLLGFDQDFYIEKVIHDYKQFEGKFNLDVTWICSRASEQDSLTWLLETVGFGELGVATYLSY